MKMSLEIKNNRPIRIRFEETPSYSAYEYFKDIIGRQFEIIFDASVVDYATSPPTVTSVDFLVRVGEELRGQVIYNFLNNTQLVFAKNNVELNYANGFKCRYTYSAYNPTAPTSFLTEIKFPKIIAIQ